MWTLHELHNISNFTTIISKMIFKKHLKDDLAFSKKHFPFTKKICGLKDDLAFSKKHFPFTKKMWGIMLRLNLPALAVLY